jgi:signal transduction histidine kinase
MMPKLRALAILPILVASFARVPFWGMLFWSRILVLMLAITSWCCLMRMEDRYFSFTDAIVVSIMALVTAWEREHCGKEIFRIQHAASTSILQSVSRDLRTPLHAVGSIIDQLSLGPTWKMSNKASTPTITDLQTFLAQASQGCKRMACLVEDLALVSTLYSIEGEGDSMVSSSSSSSSIIIRTEVSACCLKR